MIHHSGHKGQKDAKGKHNYKINHPGIASFTSEIEGEIIHKEQAGNEQEKGSQQFPVNFKMKNLITDINL